MVNQRRPSFTSSSPSDAASEQPILGDSRGVAQHYAYKQRKNANFCRYVVFRPNAFFNGHAAAGSSCSNNEFTGDISSAVAPVVQQ